jgi:potassium-dependent mechanosensitive channel
MFRSSARAALIGLALILLLAAVLQVAKAEDPQRLVSQSETLRKSVDAAAGLTDEQKTQAQARLDEAVDFVSRLEAATADRSTLEERLVGAADRLAEARRQLDETVIDTLDRGELAVMEVGELEQQVNTLRGELATRQAQLEEHESTLRGLLDVARHGGNRLADLRTRLATIQSRERDAQPGAEPLDAVDRLWRAANAAAIAAEIQAIELRRDNIELLTELARVQRDLAASRVQSGKQRVAALVEALQSRRQQDAADALTASLGAPDASADAVPGITGQIRARITGLASEQARLLVRETEYQRQLDQVSRSLDRLKKDYDRLQQAVELGGSSTQVSRLLQKRRQLAPSPERLGSDVIEYQQRIGDGGLRQLELDELLQGLAEEDVIGYLAGEIGFEADEVDLPAEREAVRELAGVYRQTALDLWQGYTRYLNVLSQLEANTRSLAWEAGRYRAFIDDRLLWVPSTGLVPLDQPDLLVDGLRVFIDPERLSVLLGDLLKLPTERSGHLLLWLLGLVLLLLWRSRALDGLRRAAEVTKKVRTDRFSATLAALFHTAALILLVPWLLVGLGLLLGGLASADNATLIYAAGLQAGGHTVLFLGTLRHLCRTNGLACEHLGWHPRLCEHLARQASWLMPLVVPLVFFAVAASASVPSPFVQLVTTIQVDDAGVLALGRLAFALQMVLTFIAIQRIWRKGGAVMTAFRADDDRAAWASYHVLWFGPALLVPLGFAVAALLGYYYTAVFLSSVAGETLWFVILAVVGRDLLRRGLYVTQRRLRFQEALRRRDELLAQRAAEAAGAPASAAGSDIAVPAIEEEKVNYNELGDQVRSLLQLGFSVILIAGLWWTWRDIFPAFSFLDQVELPITTSKLVDGIAKDVPLTLSDMAAGLLLGGLALFAAMKIPALLELTLLQRLPMSRASRYAFTTLTQYAVAMLGVVLTFNALGLQWSSIQWLVAALSVGLGFGLQEIVANFISGIILLFEQPIRVGDVVTVNGTTGTVSRIRIRATTIVNWDRQELVIPNKTFITGELINWTLSDTINRVQVTVGVDYSTDTREAMRLMREVADEHPNILADPAPLISFEGFGDNALTLVMRAYLANLDNRLRTITELHQGVLDKLREAGIEIAFPQRDVHLSTSTPLEVRVSDGRTGERPD